MTVRTIPVHVSGECPEKLCFSLNDSKNLIVATIYFAKNIKSDFVFLERVIANEGETFIEFQTQIRSIPFRSIVEVQMWSNDTGLFRGRVVFPVFNNNAVLLSGQYMFELDFVRNISSRRAGEIILDRSDRKREEMNISKSDYDYHIQPLVKEATGWNLLQQPKVYDENQVPIRINSHIDSIAVVFSDSSKAALISNHRSSVTFETRNALNNDGEEQGVLSNWMVVNGPVKVGKEGEIAGSGFLTPQELRVCVSPSPVQVIDYDLFKEHPAALKASKIHRVLPVSSLVQPNADEIALLNDIILQPMRDLSLVERELVLKFMWSLKDKKQALLKVLIVISDSSAIKGTECEDLVSKVLDAWTPVDIDSALALLGDEIGSLPAELSGKIRSYAIDRLSLVASANELQLFIFQLVQSLRFEVAGSRRCLSNFLVEKSLKDEEIASLFFWHLQCESAACEENPSASVISQQLWRELARSEMGKKIRDGLELQCQFRDRLLDMSNLVNRGGNTAKSDLLREAIRGTSGGSSIMSRLNLSNKLNYPQIGGEAVEIPIPIDPTLSLIRVDESKSFCIKSAKSPFVLSCEVFDKKTNQVLTKRYMFKTGDDLRQDQLVIQFISLMDGLFKTYGLDLKLTPYRVLATSTQDGFVEFVSDSSTLSSILSAHNNELLAYFRSVRPRSDNQFGVDPSVLDTFARSCAGYCAITYILGIGDRHMDNLLITSEGRLFHVDFGYILGRDPKPFPPPMKLCREMVEGMGGANSIYYRSFVSKCTQAFLIMRRHASLLISLLYLAADANLKDMREQDPTLAILKVQKRLMPEVSDEIAEQQMINLINESTSALFPVVMEKLHKWAVYWRN